MARRVSYVSWRVMEGCYREMRTMSTQVYCVHLNSIECTCIGRACVSVNIVGTASEGCEKSLFAC